MREIRYVVRMYHGQELPAEVRRTSSITEARQWANQCEHCEITNEEGIIIQ